MNAQDLHIQPTAGSVETAHGFVDRPTGGQSAPLLNLLESTVAPPAAIVAPLAAIPRRHTALLIGLAVLALAGGTGAALAYRAQGAKTETPTAHVVTNTAVPATASPKGTSTPAATTTPTAAAVPAQDTVTAPAVAPTVDHPQLVTVKSRSGLWLRRTPTSVNQANVVSWIPYNAAVSVDAIGDFWWHGTYKGVSGYFAVNYTK